MDPTIKRSKREAKAEKALLKGSEKMAAKEALAREGDAEPAPSKRSRSSKGVPRAEDWEGGEKFEKGTWRDVPREGNNESTSVSSSKPGRSSKGGRNEDWDSGRGLEREGEDWAPPTKNRPGPVPKDDGKVLAKEGKQREFEGEHPSRDDEAWNSQNAGRDRKQDDRYPEDWGRRGGLREDRRYEDWDQGPRGGGRGDDRRYDDWANQPRPSRDDRRGDDWGPRPSPRDDSRRNDDWGKSTGKEDDRRQEDWGPSPKSSGKGDRHGDDWASSEKPFVKGDDWSQQPKSSVRLVGKSSKDQSREGPPDVPNEGREAPFKGDKESWSGSRATWKEESRESWPQGKNADIVDSRDSQRQEWREHQPRPSKREEKRDSSTKGSKEKEGGKPKEPYIADLKSVSDTVREPEPDRPQAREDEWREGEKADGPPPEGDPAKKGWERPKDRERDRGHGKEFNRSRSPGRHEGYRGEPYRGEPFRGDRGDYFRGEGHRGDGYRGGEGYRGYRGGYRSEGYRGEGYRGDGHRGDGYRGDGYRGDGFRGDGYRGDHRGEYSRSEGYRSDFRGPGFRGDGPPAGPHRRSRSPHRFGPRESFRDDGPRDRSRDREPPRDNPPRDRSRERGPGKDDGPKSAGKEQPQQVVMPPVGPQAKAPGTTTTTSTSVSTPTTAIVNAALIQQIQAQLRAANSPAAQQARKTARRLYVGNLPIGMVGITEVLTEFLNQAMFAAGLALTHLNGVPLTGNPVLSVWLSAQQTFGFVEFRSEEETTAGMALNNIVFNGRNLRIARPADYIQATAMHGLNPVPGMNAAANLLSTPGVAVALANQAAAAVAAAAGAALPGAGTLLPQLGAPQPTRILALQNMVTLSELEDEATVTEIETWERRRTRRDGLGDLQAGKCSATAWQKWISSSCFFATQGTLLAQILTGVLGFVCMSTRSHPIYHISISVCVFRMLCGLVGHGHRRRTPGRSAESSARCSQSSFPALTLPASQVGRRMSTSARSSWPSISRSRRWRHWRSCTAESSTDGRWWPSISYRRSWSRSTTPVRFATTYRIRRRTSQSMRRRRRRGRRWRWRRSARLLRSRRRTSALRRWSWPRKSAALRGSRVAEAMEKRGRRRGVDDGHWRDS